MVEVRVLDPVEMWRPGRQVSPEHVLKPRESLTTDSLIALDDLMEVELRPACRHHGAAGELLEQMAASREGHRLAARLIVALHGLGRTNDASEVPAVARRPAVHRRAGLWVWSIPPRL
ncbi:BTAD domain-containing putative transcriptional regulator [Virgisporangium aurantiacum]|uniref:Uncharacterized protein n=1 Tax=Virgisporangium aurantiacum TaxID=175570 RepID=A0A8J3ZKU0_9ACTN|nr:BTAD domain-containing putative transcriptional regulator [Virgisporangium aurantiacum]GIJ64638.1 hypothetical protein Vau01_121540 [Virgisporangium aurantiacum]